VYPPKPASSFYNFAALQPRHTLEDVALSRWRESLLRRRKQLQAELKHTDACIRWADARQEEEKTR
jgi:hypothetical protein